MPLWYGRGFVVYRDLGGLRGVDLDELIARQVHVIAEREIELERRAAERRQGGGGGRPCDRGEGGRCSP